MLRKSTNQISIRPKWSKDKKIAVISLSVLVCFAMLFGSFKLGYRKSNFDSVEHGSYITRLESELSSFKSKEKALKQKLAVSQRDSQVEKAAYVEINKDYQKIADKNEELNRKLNFYRSIITPEDGRSGIKIHDVSTILDASGALAFEVVVIQSIDHSSSKNVSVLVELMLSKRANNSLQQWPKVGRKMIAVRYSGLVKGVFEDIQMKSGMALKITVRPDDKIDKQLVEWHEL